MEDKKKLDDEDIERIKEIISKKNLDYDSNDFEEIISYRIDFEENIYILFDNGILYKNDEIYVFDSINGRRKNNSSKYNSCWFRNRT